MIARERLEKQVGRALQRSRAVVLLGPRQSGKTTLAKAVAHGTASEYLDLESPEDAARLTVPLGYLRELRGLVILDEIQTMPALFPVLRGLLDRRPAPAKFLLLGSASPDLVRGCSETLAGRVEFVSVHGFGVNEVDVGQIQRLWLRGGFPRSYLARNESDSLAWRKNFISTFVERDVLKLGFELSPEKVRRFLMMLVHYHGQLWNGSEVAASLGVSQPTARKYLDILTGAYLVRQLGPWHENTGKRQVKAPKIYIRDTGLLHCLAGIPDKKAMWGWPKMGASWEGFCVEMIVGAYQQWDYFSWGTHGGAELDLLAIKGEKRIGIEIKATEAPAITKSMKIALEDLRLDRLLIVYLGDKSFSLGEKVEAVPMSGHALGKWLL
jgi:predicted AAA+ superfamily ATPase